MSFLPIEAPVAKLTDENLESNMIVDLSANKAGIYYLVLSGDNNRVVRKIILSK